MRTHTHTTAATAGALAAVAALLTPASFAAGTRDAPAAWLTARDVTPRTRGAAHVPDVPAAGSRPVQEANDTGESMIRAAFDGPTGGTRLELAGTTYRGSRQDGDGDDIGLTSTATPHSPAARPPTRSSGGAATRARRVLGWWPYLLAVGLLIGLVVPAPTRRRRDDGRRGGRHRAQGQP